MFSTTINTQDGHIYIHPMGRKDAILKRQWNKGTATYTLTSSGTTFLTRTEPCPDKVDWKFWIALASAVAVGSIVINTAIAHAPVTAPTAAIGGALVGGSGALAVSRLRNNHIGNVPRSC